MAKVFSRANQDIYDLANDLTSKHHAHLLHPRKVNIDIIIVLASVDDNGDKMGNAISHQGQRAMGLARILGPKDRAMGRGDREILLDGDAWPEMTDEQRAALLDHELHHFTLKRDKHRVPLIDDEHRPLLKMRKHDYQFGWFTTIARRHGKASFECQQIAQIVEKHGQIYLPGFGIGGDLGPELDLSYGADEQETFPEASSFKEEVGKTLVKGIAKAGGGSITVDGKTVEIPPEK